MRFNMIRTAFLAASLATAGCGNPLGSRSQVDDGGTTGTTTTIAPARGAEFVSSSYQSKLTSTGRFILQGTLASPTSQVSQKSPRGYVLWSNVQGQLSSSD